MDEMLGKMFFIEFPAGFDATDLMHIRRTAMKPGFGAAMSKSMQKTKESCLSRTAGGMTFSFSPIDLNLYLVGESLYRCSFWEA